MLRCLDIAGLPGSKVAPNPLVGCVIVHENSVIGEGYHSEFGGPHAEVLAIRSVKDPALLRNSILYVNLEPCSHYGKTPPCTDLIIRSGIPKVVISTEDPNPEVSGSGISKLRKAGIEVIMSVLEAEGKSLNRRFFRYIQGERPHVILKWAQSSDHFIAAKTADGRHQQTAISSQTTNIMVHKWRSEEQAILVGGNTYRIDNPMLTNRYWTGNQPVRVILDSAEGPSGQLKYGVQGTRTLVLTGNKPAEISEQGVKTIQIKDRSVEQILKVLHGEGISSLLVEGGASVLRSFLDSGLWDECRVITGNAELKDGLPAPKINREPTTSFTMGKDVIRIYHQ